MARYKRRRNNNRRTRRRPRRRKARPSIPRGLRRTGGFRMGEVKFHDTEVNARAVPSGIPLQNGYLVNPTPADCLNGIDEGTTQTTRVGRRITATKLSIKGRIDLLPDVSGTAPLQPVLVRLMVFCDKQTNKAVPVTSLILEGVTATAMAIHGFRNLTTTKRFQIISDQTYVFTPQAASNNDVNVFETAGSTKQFKLNISLNRVLYYDSVGSTIGNVTIGSYHVLCFTNAANGKVTISYLSRMRYTDY